MADAQPESGSERRFYEGPVFKGTVAVLGLLGALWAFLGPPKPFDLAKELSDNPLPLRNTEIILDASAPMGAPFEHATRLEIAAEAVKRWAAAGESSGLALRRAGGECGSSTPLTVGFDDGQSQEIAEAAEAQEPSGKSNWGLAVHTAIEEFGEERFHQPGAENQIVIFVGSGDDCDPEVGAELHNLLERTGVKAEFQLFALDVSGRQRKELLAVERQLKPVAQVLLKEADSAEGIVDAVEEVKEEEAQGLSPGAETNAPEGEAETETEEDEGAEIEPDGEPEISPETEEPPAEPEEPEEPEEVAPEGAVTPEAPVPHGKEFSSLLGDWPMTPSWTLRPDGAGRRENSPLPL